MIRVLIVEDSRTFREHLIAVLSADPALEIVGTAASGEEALAACERLVPDVVTLDLKLPGASGLVVAERLMAQRPTPILVVSGEMRHDERFAPCEALAVGAIDVLEKPDGVPDAAWNRRLTERVKLVSRIRAIRHVRARLGPRPVPLPASPTGFELEAGQAPFRLVAIGASTGGPSALAELLGALPANFPLPVLVVLHMGEVLGATFAEWLAGQCALPVRAVTDGEPLPAVGHGTVLVAPAGRHLELRGGALALSDAPERHACRPSIDVLFESVARGAGAAAIGCVLTGMGRDGAAGLAAIRRAGGATLAQDERTCVVYGIPREAARLGAVQQELPLEAIAPRLATLAARGRKGGLPG